MKPILARLASLGALCSVLLDPSAVLAQANDPARAAQALYDEATDDMDAKSYATACKKLEKVVKLVPDALGAKMKLGECYEAQGKIASAWSQYIIVESLAPKQQQTERAEKAAARAAALKPKLAMLTVDVPVKVGKTLDLTITCDGASISEAQWGTPLPVDAGPHEIRASAPSRKPWTNRVEVPGDGAKVTVKVEALAFDQVIGNKVIDNKGTAPIEPGRRWQRPLGIGLTTAGAAGLLLGSVMGGLSMAQRDASNAGPCDKQDFCEPDGTGLRNDALAFGNVSTVGFVAGGLLAGAGIALLVMAPRDKKEVVEKSAELRVLPGGFALVGRF